MSSMGHDLVRILTEITRERLVDYNRERRHLGQFFPPRVISTLLREPGYHDKYLRPREETVAILYADINSFTKLSEQVLEQPSRIGEFVDRWSTGAVDILWNQGGMFDKMVGDCIIGIFGPPFYRDRPERLALQAMRAAREMVAFTAAFGDDPMLAPFRSRPELARGLGIAVGINLCPACVGCFGPNQDVTAFSSGMNATARLQSLAGFRQILAMQSAVDAVQASPEAKDLRFGAPAETPVKNVLKPLRYCELLPG
jgi:class 3 adenylate cyclase